MFLHRQQSPSHAPSPGETTPSGPHSISSKCLVTRTEQNLYPYLDSGKVSAPLQKTLLGFSVYCRCWEPTGTVLVTEMRFRFWDGDDGQSPGSERFWTHRSCSVAIVIVRNLQGVIDYCGALTLNSSVFWVITRRTLVLNRRFGTAYRPHRG